MQGWGACLVGGERDKLDSGGWGDLGVLQENCGEGGGWGCRPPQVGQVELVLTELVDTVDEVAWLLDQLVCEVAVVEARADFGGSLRQWVRLAEMS